jgi:hypothetical protein
MALEQSKPVNAQDAWLISRKAVIITWRTSHVWYTVSLEIVHEYTSRQNNINFNK